MQIDLSRDEYVEVRTRSADRVPAASSGLDGATLRLRQTVEKQRAQRLRALGLRRVMVGDEPAGTPRSAAPGGLG